MLKKFRRTPKTRANVFGQMFWADVFGCSKNESKCFFCFGTAVNLFWRQGLLYPNGCPPAIPRAGSCGRGPSNSVWSGDIDTVPLVDHITGTGGKIAKHPAPGAKRRDRVPTCRGASEPTESRDRQLRDLATRRGHREGE